MIAQARLQSAIDAITPGINCVFPSASSATLQFSPEHTMQQRANAQAALDGFDWSDVAHAAWEVSQLRAKSLAAVATSKDETTVLLRGTIEALVGLLNKQFIWDGQFKAALANAATFAAFKSAMAAISAPPVVAKADVRKAIANEINAGKADA